MSCNVTTHLLGFRWGLAKINRARKSKALTAQLLPDAIVIQTWNFCYCQTGSCWARKLARLFPKPVGRWPLSRTGGGTGDSSYGGKDTIFIPTALMIILFKFPYKSISVHLRCVCMVAPWLHCAPLQRHSRCRRNCRIVFYAVQLRLFLVEKISYFTHRRNSRLQSSFSRVPKKKLQRLHRAHSYHWLVHGMVWQAGRRTVSSEMS